MNYSKVRVAFFSFILLLSVFSCKNEEDHSPCGRPDCSLLRITHFDNGVEQSVVNHTYVVVDGKKLLSQMNWDIPNSSASVVIDNQYDSQARLTESLTTNTNAFGTNNSKIVYEYDVTQPERIIKSTNYGNNNVVGYSLYIYGSVSNNPIRQDFYNIQDQIVAHKEFEYDANDNLTRELDFQGSTLNSRTTYSNYTSDGEWTTKLYQNLSGQGVGERETIRTFENCNLKNSIVREDGIQVSHFENTIENNLIVTTTSFDVLGNQLSNETTYEYSCD